MKKGFTLIEILAVVTIIGLIFILVIPKIATSLKNKKTDVDTTTNNLIITAAKNYVNDNHDKFDKIDNNTYCLPLTTLTKKDYLDSPVKNVTDDLDITNSKSVKITYNKGFKYEVVDKKECEVVYNEGYVDIEGNKYDVIEYLESNGFQYIDTGLTTRENMKIDVKYYINNYNSERNYVFGVYGMDGVNSGYRMQWSHTNNSFAGYGNLGTENIKTDNSKNINNLLFSEGKFYLNDTLIYDASNASLVYSADNDKNIYLFAVNGNGVISNFSSIRMYYMKMYEGNILLRDFVPVIDKNKRPCFFDKVSRECYYNQGIGEFNKYDHDDILVDKSNERYGKINYIESTGTQYIDTGLPTKENMKIDVKYYINNFEVTRNYVFGVYGNNYANRMQWSHSNTLFAGYGNLYNSNIQSDNGLNLNHLIVDKGKFYLNDIMVYDASGASQVYSANNNASINLFAVNGNGTISNFSSIRIYYMKIYDNNTLIRDYVPVITSAGKACLFDQIEKKCYYNQGSGEFLYG